MLFPTEIVTAELPAPGLEIELFENVTAAPVGTPVAVRLTELLKPWMIAVEIITLPFAFRTTLMEAGEAESVKSSGAGASAKPRTAASEIIAATATL